MKRSEQNRRDQINLPTHVSKANVLDDLGFSPFETAALKIKAELLDAILEEINRRKYTPKELTELLDDYQPQVSNLLRGKISSFSIEKLLRYAEALQMRPSLTLRSIPGRVSQSATRSARHIA